MPISPISSYTILNKINKQKRFFYPIEFSEYIQDPFNVAYGLLKDTTVAYNNLDLIQNSGKLLWDPEGNISTQEKQEKIKRIKAAVEEMNALRKNLDLLAANEKLSVHKNNDFRVMYSNVCLAADINNIITGFATNEFIWKVQALFNAKKKANEALVDSAEKLTKNFDSVETALSQLDTFKSQLNNFEVYSREPLKSYFEAFSKYYSSDEEAMKEYTELKEDVEELQLFEEKGLITDEDAKRKEVLTEKLNAVDNYFKNKDALKKNLENNIKNIEEYKQNKELYAQKREEFVNSTKNKKCADCLDSFYNDIINSAKAYADFLNNDSPGRTNSKEYDAMVETVNKIVNFKKDNPKKTGSGIKYGLEKLINELNTVCENYIDAKNSQILHFAPSHRRLRRLNEANSLRDFARNNREAIEKIEALNGYYLDEEIQIDSKAIAKEKAQPVIKVEEKVSKFENTMENLENQEPEKDM